ncbi:DUF2905 domain-containing protein [Catalinimonas niigatensis]|uniref:DUF2905 domain-containing protein n=1 Tax=Catalinimonas niigatensis TaxID=1397264 RepID=UPI002667025C|nr:DUF2905 domain-containing protein [Catalinimonas niigatensis]WPP53495.1 DUF2905 domain-containing protein [Catalinimonas niigatensis]
MGKLLIIFGLIIVVLGIALYFSDRFPSIGKLPGNIVIKRENFTFYFPLATSILLSIIISLIFYLINKFS